MADRGRVVAAVRAAGYRYVTLDLEGLRSGNLNDASRRSGLRRRRSLADVRPADVPESVDDYARALADAIEAALPGWVTGAVERVMAGQSAGDDPRDQAGRRRGRRRRPRPRPGPPSGPCSRPTSTTSAAPRSPFCARPCSIPTRVLQDAGVPPVRRDRFAERAFPDDLYDLTPASLADVDPALTDLGISWGAAKAFEHKRRHRPRPPARSAGLLPGLVARSGLGRLAALPAPPLLRLGRQGVQALGGVAHGLARRLGPARARDGALLEEQAAVRAGERLLLVDRQPAPLQASPAGVLRCT